MDKILDKAPQVVLLAFGAGGVLAVLVTVGAAIMGRTLDAQTAQLVDKMLTVGVSVVAGAGASNAAALAKLSLKAKED